MVVAAHKAALRIKHSITGLRVSARLFPNTKFRIHTFK